VFSSEDIQHQEQHHYDQSRRYDMSNQENEKSSFDLFGKPDTDDLHEHLEKGSYQWTNKYTRILGGAVIVVALLSGGAWYGHHSATSAATTPQNAISALRAAFGGGSGTGGGSGFSGFGGGSSGGGFGGIRVTGSITNVSGSNVTIKLDDPTQGSSLKSGDSARVTDTGIPAGSGAGAGQMPSGAAPSTSTKTSGKSSATTNGTKPSVSGSSSGGQGGRGGFFNNPTLVACLKQNGVTITPGVRPDRTDPKVQAAFAKCFTGFGGGQGAGTSSK
jgi:hypothetical protein